MSMRYLKEYITIESAVESVDLSGCKKIQWEEIRKCCADVVPLFNSSYLASQHSMDKIVSTNNYYSMLLRSSIKINNQMRVVWKGRVFNIIRYFEYNKSRRFIKIIVVEKY